MKEELAVFEKVKTMFGGIEYILPGLDRLKKTEFQFPVSKPNKTERPFNDFLPPSPDFFQLGDYGISQMFLAVETLYSDVLVTEFIAKLEKNSRSKVSFSSFKDLDGERQRVGDYSFPMSLVSTANAIMDAHGDVTKNSHFSPPVVENIYVFFCAAIKEMGDLSLKQVTEDTMLKWRDAIMDAKRSGCDVEFAWKHLETIAYAYFGLKARNYRISLEQKMANLMAEEKSLRQQLEKKEEEVKAVKGKEEELTSLQCKMCQDCVDRFLDKNVGLFG
ncbi:uncharacterized protein LOC111301316 isoform X2 [Durio zibethinus]|uniref:Uncharacterized protein LOC111301316 isoform X2 n=1 Tax=Durio zibethinus TaxID=66656 RepID=A0A6P5ZID5_DURZI|nr:uncharacterized protein LOC111301316 isoform X2 [Durio zibethinus]